MRWLIRERRATAAAQLASIRWLVGRGVLYDTEEALECARQQQRQDLVEVLEHAMPPARNRWVTAEAHAATCLHRSVTFGSDDACLRSGGSRYHCHCRCRWPFGGRDSGAHPSAPQAAWQGATDRWAARTARQGLRAGFGVYSDGRLIGMCVAAARSSRQVVSPPRDVPGVQKGVADSCSCRSIIQPRCGVLSIPVLTWSGT